MPELPTGTLTLLFSDIEGSTKLLDDLGPEQYAIALKRHRSLMRRAFADNGGTEVDTQGDAFFCVFRRAADALQAAADLQRAHAAEEWPPGSELRVRVGLHTGDAIRAGAGYVGTALHRAARVMSAGHGAQVLLSQPTADLAQDELPEGLAVRDLGEHRLKDLSQSQHLYQLLADGLPSTFPPLKTLENRPTNLPQQPNRLIGREKELEQIIDRLRGRDTRLLTLVGPGGTGKTRLALQACAEVVDDFADGVFFVSLAPLRDATLVYANIAATLGVREQGGQTLDEALAEYLRRKDLLLLLDNFEQVVEAAPQLAPLLDSSNVSLLVTSREPLRVAAERVHSVPPLSTPNATGRSQPPTPSRTPRSGSSSSVPAQFERSSSSRTRSRPTWQRSVGSSTGCRSRWSSRPRGRTCSPPARFASASERRLTRSVPADGTSTNGSEHSVVRSPGATTSSPDGRTDPVRAALRLRRRVPTRSGRRGLRRRCRCPHRSLFARGEEPAAHQG